MSRIGGTIHGVWECELGMERYGYMVWMVWMEGRQQATETDRLRSIIRFVASSSWLLLLHIHTHRIIAID